jgi:hypothetical protein
MGLHVPISEDLPSILDRVLDKSIVIDSVILMGLQSIQTRLPDTRACVASSSVYVGYGNAGSWQEGKDMEELFPFWRRDLWTK